MEAIYLRFVVGTNRPREGPQTGVVTELRLLLESGDLPPYEHAHVAELFEWLNTHLPCPPFSENPWESAICWFKGSAREMIAKFREIIAILEEHGRPVRMIKTAAPGSIQYEDDYQVVAVSDGRF